METTRHFAPERTPKLPTRGAENSYQWRVHFQTPGLATAEIPVRAIQPYCQKIW